MFMYGQSPGADWYWGIIPAIVPLPTLMHKTILSDPQSLWALSNEQCWLNNFQKKNNVEIRSIIVLLLPADSKCKQHNWRASRIYLKLKPQQRSMLLLHHGQYWLAFRIMSLFQWTEADIFMCSALILYYVLLRALNYKLVSFSSHFRDSVHFHYVLDLVRRAIWGANE